MLLYVLSVNPLQKLGTQWMLLSLSTIAFTLRTRTRRISRMEQWIFTTLTNRTTRITMMKPN